MHESSEEKAESSATHFCYILSVWRLRIAGGVCGRFQVFQSVNEVLCGLSSPEAEFPRRRAC